MDGGVQKAENISTTKDDITIKLSLISDRVFAI